MAQEKIQGASAQPTPTENEAAPQQAAKQPQARPCPQDCRMCGVSQQIFCTTKMLFDLSRRQQVMGTMVGEITKVLSDILTQLNKKDKAAELSIPFSEG